MIPSRLLKRLSVADLKAAIKHKAQYGRVEALESEKETLLKQVAELDKKLAKLGSNGAASSTPRKRRSWKLSAATRRKMAEAARKRWAKASGKAEAAPKKRWTMSAATRAKMAAAAKARWAKAKGKSTPAPVKRRRTLSAATRAKMAAAAKARWAKVKGRKAEK